MTEERKFIIRCRGIIIHENKLLVVRHTHDASFVALPGGHLEWGEDVLECLSRELIEELGVKPDIGRLLYVNTFMDGTSIQPTEFFFEITNGEAYLDAQNLARTHAYELAEIIWMKPGDSLNLLPTQIAKDFQNGTILADQPRYIKD
ncbi:MAG: NUDIX domain-containing protein [Candidatus Doudnabacteria bacterium]|nr:NUDIX domain-containing protein [Candidatus Doudnabacteria bacterium]